MRIWRDIYSYEDFEQKLNNSAIPGAGVGATFGMIGKKIKKGRSHFRPEDVLKKLKSAYLTYDRINRRDVDKLPERLAALHRVLDLCVKLIGRSTK